MTVASTEVDMITAKQALEDLYKYHDLAKAEAQQAIASAQDAVRDAERHVNSIKNGSRQVDISSAQANVILFRDILEDAQEDFDKHGNKPEHNVTRALYQAQLAEAQRQYEDAVRLLNNLESSPDEIDLAIAEAELAYAKAQLIIAEADYETLKNGPDPDDIAIAEANIKALEAQVPLVAAELSSAKADYHLLQNQSEKLILSSPIDGVVLYRNQEPGEFAQPGTIIITLTSLDELTVTVSVSYTHLTLPTN